MIIRIGPNQVDTHVHLEIWIGIVNADRMVEWHQLNDIIIRKQWFNDFYEQTKKLDWVIHPKHAKELGVPQIDIHRPHNTWMPEDPPDFRKARLSACEQGLCNCPDR